MKEKRLLTPQIYTPEGFAESDIFAGEKKLDVGCGLRKLPGAVGIDLIKNPTVDIVHDLSIFPWPIAGESYDVILMNSVLEHMQDVLKTMEEIYRISRPGARIIIKVPYFRSVDAYADPTHYHFFASRSMDFFMEGTEFRHYGYTDVKFKKLSFWYGWPHPSGNPFKQALKLFVHRFPDFYDQHLSLILPVECVFWELEAIK